MAIIKGLTALESVKHFRARNWYSKEFPKLGARVETDYNKRCEVVKGGKVTDGSGSNRYKTILTCSNTYYLASGKMIPVSTASGSITDVSAKDVFNADGDQASLAIAYGNSGTDPASGNYIVTSNSITFKVRIYNSQTTSEVYDVSSDADIQVDKGHTDSTLTADLALIKAKFDALCVAGQKFAGYSSGSVGGADGSAATLTLTAPVGEGKNFTDTSGSIANLSSSATNVTVEFSGVIFTNGSSASGVDTNGTEAYVAIIATDSDGAGGAILEGTYGKLLAVVSGTSTSALGTAYPTTEEIHAALAASSSSVSGYNHSGATGFVHIAQVKNAAGTLTIVSNINNHKNA